MPAPEDRSETEVRRFDDDGWTVRIHLTGTGPDGFLAGHADVSQAGLPRCRLMLVGQRHDAASATEVLETRARDFIADWSRRDHSGRTGFAEL
ncbi:MULTISPECIES: hypothetical protein [unclassified Variovorax]|uniref:hypothetical protein n=1 Tax=unclassified Variovorax TaxID=663243 RepID=UPI002578DE59|nr:MULTISPECIES: hypothetical protein [unclassified Variovorax]MDM0087750.1 hypothetical protein [Variovorax sp. J22G40]MDM0143993.1 hypothetical protein [Variovorax sp. J2P1-31]